MSGDVIATKDLQVPPAGAILDYLFFNKRFQVIVSAINLLAARQDGFDAAETDLVSLGLQRVDAVLGPLLTQLQQAAQLGFLIARATGPSVTLVPGLDIQFTVNSAGFGVFTPTPWVMAMDVNDSTNWGVFSLNAYSPITGVFAGHCVYASKTKASNTWELSCNSAVIPAVTDLLDQATAAAAAATAAYVSIGPAVAQIQALLQIVQGGPVISVAGRSGSVTLGLDDVVGLVDALTQKATTASLVSGLATKQNASAQLTTFAALVSNIDKLPYFSGVGTMSMATLTAFARSLIASVDAVSVRGLLQLGDAATHLASDFVAVGASIPSNQIAAVFNDQVGVAYTFQASDNGKPVTLTNAAAIAATLPNNLPKGWNVIAYQGGAGQITFSAAGGALLRNRQSQSKTAGLYAMVSLLCISNTTGTNAVYVLGGDTA